MPSSPRPATSCAPRWRRPRATAHLALLKLGNETEAGPGKSLKIINRQIDRMAKLVEDLLDISRLQAGRLSLELERFDMSDLVRETRDRMAVLSQGHELHVEMPELAGGHVGPRAPGPGAHQPPVQRHALLPRGRAGAGAARRRGREGVHLAVKDRGVGIPRRSRRSSSSASAARTAASTAGWGWGSPSARASSSSTVAASGWSPRPAR